MGQTIPWTRYVMLISFPPCDNSFCCRRRGVPRGRSGPGDGGEYPQLYTSLVHLTAVLFCPSKVTKHPVHETISLAHIPYPNNLSLWHIVLAQTTCDTWCTCVQGFLWVWRFPNTETRVWYVFTGTKHVIVLTLLVPSHNDAKFAKSKE